MSSAVSSKGPQVQFGKVYRVLHKDSPPQPYSVILEHRQQESALLFESNAIAVLSPQEIDAVKRQYTKLQDAYGCLGILQFNSGETTILYLITVIGCISVGKINECEIYKITQTSFISLRNQPQDEEHVSEIKKLLHSGTFYFCKSVGISNTFDLSLCAQRQRKTTATDNRFFWNRMLHIYFLRYGIDTSSWLLKITCGNIDIRTVYIRHKQARAVIISRLSCERAGTRFNVRGCNDDGHVANFVETEQSIFLDDKVSSYVQSRGSVPLFWEQTGVQVGSHKVKMSRGIEASTLAYEKHFSMMKQRYGNQVIVNLLNSTLTGNKESEAMLSQMFQNHHNTSSHSKDVPHLIFDYHAECRSGNTKNLSKLKEQVASYLNQFGFFYAKADEVICEQKGVIRTNCLDCLDRTNCVQTFFGLEILKSQLDLLCDLESQQILSRFEEVFRQMWVNNGNEVSKTYAGTGAIQGGSKLIDGARSAARTIQNNLLDNSKQEAIDVFLLGNTLNSELADRARMLLAASTLHASTNILREMCSRYQEYTNSKSLRIAVGTYNVNGGKHFRSVVYKDVSLSDWLLDSIRIAKTKSLIDTFVTSDDEIPVDIFAVGFEEIVDLNASNIMAASSENATLWAEELQKVLSRDHDYVMLTYVQLVGVCLYIFVRCNLVNAIKDVAVDSVKTGLGGATGNKGAVAIRFVIYSTSMCFICSHFAAGQSQVTERNADYTEITRKIAFPMGRTLSSHDYIFWCGDFNYRVDMDKDTMKELIKNKMLQDILQCDQLLIQKKENKIFQDYIEGEITFPPTYKYDLFSDDYDTSEKCRAPAWTDRVLWKKRKQCQEEDLVADWNPGRLIHYGRAELKQSDHRPVVAVIEVDICCVDTEKRDQVFTKVIKDVGPLDATIILKVTKNTEYDISSIFDDNFMSTLLNHLSTFGEVILVRFVEDTMWVTFKDGKSALSAVDQQFVDVNGYQLEMSLKAVNWVDQTWKEINICCDNTVPLSIISNEQPLNENQTKYAPKTNESVRNVPSRPPLPTVNKPKAGVFSIPPNLHQPLQPVSASQTEQKVPTRPAPPVPGLPAPPPPVRQRNIPPTPMNTSSTSQQPQHSSIVPPPLPARTLPPVPPR